MAELLEERRTKRPQKEVGRAVAQPQHTVGKLRRAALLVTVDTVILNFIEYRLINRLSTISAMTKFSFFYI